MTKPTLRTVIVFPSGKAMMNEYDDRKEFLGQMAEIYDILRSDDHYLFIARGISIEEKTRKK
jgi:hypothetical protein